MKLSRQRRYQLRMKELGCCVICGKPAHATECAVCLEKRADRQRGKPRTERARRRLNERKRYRRAIERIKRRGKNRCSDCGRPGHNRITCTFPTRAPKSRATSKAC